MVRSFGRTHRSDRGSFVRIFSSLADGGGGGIFQTGVADVLWPAAAAQRMNGRWGTTAQADGKDISIDFERVDEAARIDLCPF